MLQESVVDTLSAHTRASVSAAADLGRMTVSLTPVMTSSLAPTMTVSLAPGDSELQLRDTA